MSNQLLQTVRTAKAKVDIYPFTPSDLALLVWADWHHPPAAAAIVAAENKATDDPSQRPAANAYISDCLAAIRRRMEMVEKADDMLWGFRMQEKWRAERDDRMSQGTSGGKCNGADQRAAELSHANAPKPALDVIPRKPQARKRVSGTGILFAATDAAECTA